MSEMFFDAAPNATRVAPARPLPRDYPATKPGDVYLFGTCVVDLFYPEAGLDAIRLLEREGVRVHFPDQQSCCGQPAYTSGYTDEARAVARAQLALFERDYPLVVPSGSCAGMFRHHYPALFADDPVLLARAQALAERTFELAEFLLEVCRVQWRDQGPPVAVALHTSCSARREMNTHLHVRALLDRLDNVERREHDHESECCGFGGTFCVRMPEISGAMVANKVESLERSGAARMVTADGGCLMNISGAMEKRAAGMPSEHLASFLWRRTNPAAVSQ